MSVVPLLIHHRVELVECMIDVCLMVDQYLIDRQICVSESVSVTEKCTDDEGQMDGDDDVFV